MTQHSLERALLDEKIRNNCRLKHRIKKSSLTWNKIPKRLQRFVFGLLIPWMTAINDSAIVPAPWSKHLSAVSQISHQKRHKNEDSEALVLSLFLFLFRNKPLCIIQVHFIFKSKMRHISQSPKTSQKRRFRSFSPLFIFVSLSKQATVHYSSSFYL